MILSGKIDGIITALKAIASEHRTVNDFRRAVARKIRETLTNYVYGLILDNRDL